MPIVDLAVACEERGFELLWTPEHSHIPLSRKSPFPGGGDVPKMYYDAMDPFVTLTAAAAATKKLKVGTGVCLVIQRDTIQTAKLAASLDQVSEGRFLFGIGGGWNQDEMEDHGTVYATRFKRMREQIEAMREIWTKSKPEYHGELVDFPPMMTWPKPVQNPLPIIVGGAFPHAARRAVRYGNGWIPIAGRGRYGNSKTISRSTNRCWPRPGAASTMCRSRCSAPPPDYDQLMRYKESRCGGCPPSRRKTLPLLDKWRRHHPPGNGSQLLDKAGPQLRSARVNG